MMNRRLVLTAAATIVGATAAAAEPAQVAVFSSWKVYTSNEPDGKMCFVAAQPSDSKYSQTITSRDPVFFMITSIPAKKIRNEVSTIVGYAFGPSATVQLDIDGMKSTMFTANTDTAWAMADNEAALVNLLKGGATLKVNGTSKRGTTTTDTYSLTGITAALQRMAMECP